MKMQNKKIEIRNKLNKLEMRAVRPDIDASLYHNWWAAENRIMLIEINIYDSLAPGWVENHDK